jgi:hypothetical protein
MKLTEEEKKDYMSKYDGSETSQELLNYLKRNYPTHTLDMEFLKEPQTMISIDGKSYFVRSNKKFLVGKIYFLVEDIFKSLDKSVIRRTIKKFIDGIYL